MLERRLQNLEAVEESQQEMLADMNSCNSRLERILASMKLLLRNDSGSKGKKDQQPRKLSERVELALREKKTLTPVKRQ